MPECSVGLSRMPLQKRKGSMKPEILAIIPARGGSKGVPRKNIKMFAGKPLIAWTIEAALTSAFVDRTVVSTEDAEIAEVAKQWGAEVIDRPTELAQDETLITPVLEHVITTLENREGYKPEFVVLLNPTSPLRGKDHLDIGIRPFIWGDNDSSVSVTPRVICLWEIREGKAWANYDYGNKPRRQDSPISFSENGAIYIVRTKFLMEEHRFIGGKISLFAIPPYNALDINTPLDFKVAELVMNEALQNESVRQ